MPKGECPSDWLKCICPFRLHSDLLWGRICVLRPQQAPRRGAVDFLALESDHRSYTCATAAPSCSRNDLAQMTIPRPNPIANRGQ